MNEMAKLLREADARGVAPPQNWTTRAADEIERACERSEFWEANHLAGNAEIDRLRAVLREAKEFWGHYSAVNEREQDEMNEQRLEMLAKMIGEVPNRLSSAGAP